MRIRNLLFACLLVCPAGLAHVVPQSVQITVRHESDSGWNVRYELPHPILKAGFSRDSHFRAETWKVMTEGVKITESDDGVYLESVSDEPFDTVEIHFSDITRTLPKDYTPMVPFRGGGVLFYTGHLNLDAYTKHQFNLKAAKGEQLLFKGKPYKESVEWADEDGAGTYVYFGLQKPIQTPYMTALIDTGLPDWLQGKAQAFLPRLFDYYSKAFEIKLPFKPTIYYSYRETELEHTNSSGGVLPREIQMQLYGRGWLNPNSHRLPDLFWFFAHEAAHAWLGQLFKSDKSNHNAWIHEGGASAMANRALLDLGLIEIAGYRKRFEQSLNKCAGYLEKYAMSDFTEHQLYEAHYACGAIFAFAAEAAARQTRPGATQMDFWRRFFSEAVKLDNAYTAGLYLSTVASFTGSQALVKAMTDVIELPAEDGMSSLQSLMDAAGIQVVAKRRDIPPDQAYEWGARAMRLLMRTDCNGYLSFWRNDDHFKVQGLPQCAVLTGREFFYVQTIAGKRVEDQGASLYDAVRQTCQNKDTVSIGLRNADDPLNLPCPEKIPERLPWLEVLLPDQHAASLQQR